MGQTTRSLAQYVTPDGDACPPDAKQNARPHLTGASIQQRCTNSAIHLLRNNYSEYFALFGNY